LFFDFLIIGKKYVSSEIFLNLDLDSIFARQKKIIVIRSHLRPKMPTNSVEVVEVAVVVVAAAAVGAETVGIEDIERQNTAARLGVAVAVVDTQAKNLIN
jgi:hypothetical protein